MREYIEKSEAGFLQSLLGARAGEIAEVVPEIREKLPDLQSPPQLETEQARFRLFDSITGMLKNASQAMPVLLVLEDLHSADRSSLL